MFSDDDSAGEAACSYTNDFLVQAIHAIDQIFGDGYARENPSLVGAYLQASATNLGAFMTAATAMPPSSELEQMMVALEGAMPEPAPKAKKKATRKTKKATQ